MAGRRTTPKELRDAVERTVQTTFGSAQDAVDEVVKSAETGLRQSRKAVRDRAKKAVDRRPATADDVRELRTELRSIVRRLDVIEERLPAKRKSSPRSAASGGKRSAARTASKPRSARGGSRASKS